MRKPEKYDFGYIENILHRVDVEDIEIMSGEIKHDRIAIVDLTMKELLGIFTSGYTLIQHNEMINVLRDFFSDEFHGNISYNVKRLYIYIYPDNWVYTLFGDKVQFGIRCVNSHDGSNALKVELVGYNITKGYGMFTQEFVKRGYQRHTLNANTDQFRNSVKNILEMNIQEILTEYEKLDTMVVDVEDVLQIVKLPKSLIDILRENLPPRETLWKIYSLAADKITNGFRESKGKILTVQDYWEGYAQNLHENANSILRIPERKKIKIEEVEL